jgi:Putative beta-barrel porin-2, OmpL-like. bbp2
MQRNIGWIWAVSLVVCSLVAVGGAQAQETAPPATALAEPPAKPTPWSPIEATGLAGPLKSWGLEIHGLLSTNYTWNFNEPASGKNGLLLMNRKHDHGDLDIANIRIQRVVDGELGFVTDLDFGKTAEVVGRSTWWCGGISPSVSGKGSCSESRNSFEATQAYLTYKFALGNGLSVKAGKWATLHGAEVIKTWDNINYNISNSILFGWAIPFTHTGMIFNYPFYDWLSTDLGFIVGWDTVADNNDGKGFTGGLNVAPLSNLTFYAALTVGPEQQNRGDSTRYLYSLLTTYKPTDQWTFMLDYNVANETNLLPPFELEPTDAKPSGRGSKTAYWDGLAGYAIYHFTDELSLTLRAEFFNDADGVRTGVKQTVWELTPTVAYQFLPGLTFRAEFRHDESSKKFFEGHAIPLGTRLFSGQDTVAWEVLYSF